MFKKNVELQHTLKFNEGIITIVEICCKTLENDVVRVIVV